MQPRRFDCGVLNQALRKCFNFKHLLHGPKSEKLLSRITSPTVELSSCSQAHRSKPSPTLVLSATKIADRKRLLKKRNLSLVSRPTVSQQFARCLSSASSEAGRIQERGRVTVESVCKRWAEQLEKSNVPEPRVSVEYIVAYVLGRKTLFGVDGSCELNQQHVIMVDTLCQRRMQHEPLQYILGEWDFEDIELKMKPPVFIPRAETEELVSLAARMIKDKSLQSGHLLELCCGSGAITLALLHKFPLLHGVAVDISPEACSLTQENVSQLGLAPRLMVIQGDVADDTVQKHLISRGPFDILVSNPPYIPTCQLPTLEPQILQYEDIGALDGGEDGLDIIRHIIHVSPQLLKPDSDILLEIQPGQPAMIRQIVSSMKQSHLHVVSSHLDFTARERFCHLRTAWRGKR